MAEKEIGMEKLIELLNERMKEEEKIGPKHSRFLNYDGINHVFSLNNECSFCMELVLSKRYGFIKWLVENDKIDREKVKEKSDRIPLLLDKVGDIYNCGVLKSVLMLLSISDTPIDDLISYLR